MFLVSRSGRFTRKGTGGWAGRQTVTGQRTVEHLEAWLHVARGICQQTGTWQCVRTCRPSRRRILTLPPEAQAPLGRGDFAVPVGVAGVEERPDADLVLVQVDGRQLGLVQVQISIGVQLGKHPAYGVLTAGYQAPVQHCKHRDKQTIIFF